MFQPNVKDLVAEDSKTRYSYLLGKGQLTLYPVIGFFTTFM